MTASRLFVAVAFLASPAIAHPDHGSLAVHHRNRPTVGAVPGAGRAWLPGDHHIHSEFSADYAPYPASPQTAPIPLLGKDGRYSISKNAEKARQFGLRWMVSTDHGGRNWNDTAPRVAIGMEGAPGHQAGALKPDGSPDPIGNRGGYGRAVTLGASTR